MRKDPIRAKLEAFGSHLTLPVARAALGSLEGEHGSSQYGHGYDYLDLRPYAPGDEAELIDWKASGRAGKPIIINKQREVNNAVWLMLDVSSQMGATARSGETLLDVAANALRMFALLSLKRSDSISLILADSRTITRIPFAGGYPKFDHMLTDSLAELHPAPRDLTSMLRYAEGIRSRNSLIVIASDDSAMDARHEKLIATISQDHPLVFISVEPVNPFDPANRRIQDAQNGKLMPAFLQNGKLAREIDTRSRVLALGFDRALARHGDTLLRGGSSDEMLTNFIHLVSTRRNGMRPNQESLLPRLQKEMTVS